MNLLQPQDRRSKRPGDAKDAALARRRLAEAGHEAAMLDAVIELFDAAAGQPRPAPASVLDLGCGEGFLLGSLAAAREVRACGVDISTPANELAAPRWPAPAWIVANADRRLPWPDGAFDFVMSITARRNAPEIRRLLAPAGRALLAVPGEDDLVELREAVLGRGDLRDRSAKLVDELRPELELVSRRSVRRTAVLDPQAVRDLLAATYRGGRRHERARAEKLGGLEVTMSRELLLFRPRAPAVRPR